MKIDIKVQALCKQTDFKETNSSAISQENHSYNKTTDHSQLVQLQTQDETEVKSKINELLLRENGMLTCQVCGKTGQDLGNMQRHVETHIDGLSYNCQLCGKTFRSKNSLNGQKARFHNKTF